MLQSISYAPMSDIFLFLFTFYSVTESGVETRMWRLQHKDIDYVFSQQQNPGGKSWNTGVFKRKLVTLAKGKSSAGRDLWIMSRAKFILAKREGITFGVTVPHNNLKFFPFEEDLEHQIREGILICGTGIVCSFFNNPFVRDYIRGLEPRHRVVYRLKLVRIIRCIMDVLQSEVNPGCFLVC